MSDWAGAMFAAFVICVVVGGGTAIYFAQEGHSEWTRQCEAAGGVAFAARNGRICLKPDSVIRL